MGRHYLNIDIDAYLGDTQELSAMASGAYLHLLMYYRVHRSLPHQDDEAMRQIARMTPQQWRRNKPVLAGFFDKDWRSPRLERDLAKGDRISLLRAMAGQTGGRSSGMSRRARAHSVDN